VLPQPLPGTKVEAAKLFLSLAKEKPPTA
jgi:hypothetical protein